MLIRKLKKRIDELEERIRKLEEDLENNSLSNILTSSAGKEYIDSFFGGSFDEVMDGKEGKKNG